MYNPFFTHAFVNIFLVIIALWTIPWKIYAIWTAVKNDQKKWFVALLLLNTLSILEIYYIFHIAKKKWSEVKTDFKRALSSVKK
ncbi:hypothetical protein A3F19_02890 [Candidatus Nomurabacteria bacterium RIFCSPHIGHO2_12_FULL_37_29]|uniref:DUF5652 domain-containing protein n=1 Tax=Candidatus Nomurabacteria bacterium RIFCSPHIGHO2_12_FULL_37_29 TaxID=1801759 RepID=A0A1F6WB35_9BACT|nr:MAG: hypothetical protein A3F19_02890 [Candidatus Nomurabacteria bacterium RIFCSPHIGHO2_12_FULL_37_29]OGI84385.1 MAG: hypothetical protein A3A92_01725 [Candidatus Nomurabacteria bacterium RIFCSPLOWO2_01_FULL_37_49]